MGTPRIPHRGRLKPTAHGDTHWPYPGLRLSGSSIFFPQWSLMRQIPFVLLGRVTSQPGRRCELSQPLSGWRLATCMCMPRLQVLDTTQAEAEGEVWIRVLNTKMLRASGLCGDALTARSYARTVEPRDMHLRKSKITVTRHCSFARLGNTTSGDRVKTLVKAFSFSSLKRFSIPSPSSPSSRALRSRINPRLAWLGLHWPSS